jgi:hypothetical protein
VYQGVEKPVRTTQATASATSLSAVVQEYTERGWTVAETANGVSLITDDTIAAVEVSGELAAGVRQYLEANQLAGPAISIPGQVLREVHLVTGIAKSTLAVAALREMGAIVHTAGDTVMLPPTQLRAGSANWAVAPADAPRVPPMVVLSAAVRAIQARAKSAQQPARALVSA